MGCKAKLWRRIDRFNPRLRIGIYRESSQFLYPEDFA